MFIPIQGCVRYLTSLGWCGQKWSLCHKSLQKQSDKLFLPQAQLDATKEVQRKGRGAVWQVTGWNKLLLRPTGISCICHAASPSLPLRRLDKIIIQFMKLPKSL